MPTAIKSPDFTPKSMVRRKVRAERVLQLICTVEPPHIANDLRKMRRSLAKRFHAICDEGSAGDVHFVVSDYCRVSDQLLRLARIPLPPPGAKLSGRMPTPIDLVPEFDASEVSTSSDPGESAPVGDGFD